MTLRNATKVLLFLVLGLPLLQAVLMWVESLLTAMGDKAATVVVSHIITTAGGLWLVTLVGMVVILAIQSLDSSPGPVEEDLNEFMPQEETE
ncbi:MAG: hypothetical protein ABGX16_18970 [Pirellulales bacterium]